MKPIKIKTVSVPGTSWEVSPRAGFVGWLGRQLKIYHWGWVERNVTHDVERITADEINMHIKKELPWNP